MNISRSEEPFYAVFVSYDRPLQTKYRQMLIETLIKFTLDSPTHPVVSYFFPNSCAAVFLNMEGKLSELETPNRYVIDDLDEAGKEAALQELLLALKMSTVPILDTRFQMYQDLFIHLLIPESIRKKIDPIQQWRLCRFIQKNDPREHFTESCGCLADEEMSSTLKQEQDTIIGCIQ